MDLHQQPRQLSARYSAALEYANELHRGQVRKATGAPYIAHLLSVSALVLEYGGDEDEAIAALLHDSVEDQGGSATLAQVRARFGDRVAAIVAGCTELQWQPGGPRWRERKEEFIARLAEADDSVRLVVAADKLHNTYSYLRDYARFGDELWSRFKNGRAGLSWFVRAVWQALSARGELPILRELDTVLQRLENL